MSKDLSLHGPNTTSVLAAAEDYAATLSLTLFKGGPLELATSVEVPDWLESVVYYTSVLVLVLWLLRYCGTLFTALWKRLFPSYSPHVLRAYERFTLGLDDVRVSGRHDTAVAHRWAEWNWLGRELRANRVAQTWQEWNLLAQVLRRHIWHKQRQARRAQ